MLGEEDYTCICGAEFDDMEGLAEHWETNNRATTGMPHYRLVKFSGEYEPPPSTGKTERKEP